jgi:hypothetical protein
MAALTVRVQYCCHLYAFTQQLNAKWQEEARAQSVRRYANISPVFGCFPPSPKALFAKIAIILQPELMYCRGCSTIYPPLFSFGTVFNYHFTHTYPSKRLCLGEVLLNLVLSHSLSHTQNGVRASAVQEIRLQKYLENVSHHAEKVITFLSHQSNTFTQMTGHCEL